MGDFQVKHLLLAAMTLVIGLVLGGLGPRAEVRALEEKAECEPAPKRDVGREVARVFAGGPWAQPKPSPEPLPPPEPPLEEEPGDVQSELTAPDDAERADVDAESIDAVREVMAIRRAAAEQALAESGATDGEIDAFHGIVDDMNIELQTIVEDFVVVMGQGEPERREMMAFAADTLEVFLAAEDRVVDAIPAEIRDGAKPEVFDPMAFIDGEMVALLAELDQ